MGATRPTEFRIKHALFYIAADRLVGVSAPLTLLPAHAHLEPRLLARRYVYAHMLTRPQPPNDDGRHRCAGGPRHLIDLVHMRDLGLARGKHRLQQWRDDVPSLQIRQWERILLRQGSRRFVEYWSLRITAADALLTPDEPVLCPADNEIGSRQAYVRAANRVLDLLPDDTLIMAVKFKQSLSRTAL